jgi:hypothetical protein
VQHAGSAICQIGKTGNQADPKPKRKESQPVTAWQKHGCQRLTGIKECGSQDEGADDYWKGENTLGFF